MEAIKKLVGVYLVGVSVAVAVFFIINIFLLDAISVLAVWHVLMLTGLARTRLSLPRRFAPRNDRTMATA